MTTGGGPLVRSSAAEPESGTGAPEREQAAGPDVRLVPAAAVAWLAGWWGSGAPVALTGTAAAGCAALAVAAVTAGRTRRRPRGATGHRRAVLWQPVALALAAGLAVLASATGTAVVRSAGPFPSWIADRAVVDLTGSLASDPRRLAAGAWGGPPRYAVRLQVTRVRARAQTRVVDAPVLVLGGPSWAALSAGMTVVVTGRLSPSDPADDVVAVVSAIGGPAAVAPGAWWWRAADRVRAGLRGAVEGLPADAGGLLPSLVLGDTSTLQPRVAQNLTTAGLTHLTAVSGANVAIVLGSILWLAGSAGAARRPRIVLAAVGLAGFVVLARPQPSVLRAAAMGGVALVALGVGRRARGVPALSAAVVVLLVLDPWLARNAGFALSAVATGALLLLAPPWARRLGRWMPRPLALALAVPAAAQAACGPIVVLLNPSVSLAAIPANLLAEPAVAPATVLGVVAALLSLVWPWGAHVVAAVSCVVTWWITWVAGRAASLPGASVPWLSGVPGALALTGLTAAAVVASLRVAPLLDPASPGWSSWLGAGVTKEDGVLDRARRQGFRRPRSRGWRQLAGLVSAVLLAVLGGWLLAPWLAGRLPVRIGGGESWPPRSWSVVMCDVGQGDALVARSGADRAVLVDAGPEPSAVDGCLSRLGVRHLDLVVLTHFHADHVLGLPGALHGRDAAVLLVSPLAQPAENAQAVYRWARAAGVQERAAWAGAGGQAGSDGWHLRWQVLLPDATTVPKSAAQPSSGMGRSDDGPGDGSTVNESSIATVMEVRAPDGGTVRLAGLGDLEVPGQERLASLLSGDADPRVDVVKVAHHGSAKQDGDLYRLLGPRIALIGVGAANDYGHPTASALDLLSRLGAVVRRTDLSTDIAVSVSGDLLLSSRR